MGTFEISQGGQTTGPIPYDQLPAIGNAHVERKLVQIDALLDLAAELAEKRPYTGIDAGYIVKERIEFLLYQIGAEAKDQA